MGSPIIVPNNELPGTAIINAYLMAQMGVTLGPIRIKKGSAISTTAFPATKLQDFRVGQVDQPIAGDNNLEIKNTQRLMPRTFILRLRIIERTRFLICIPCASIFQL